MKTKGGDIVKYSGLLGKSIKYSISPFIHNEFYRLNNIPLDYRIFDLEEEQLDDFIKILRKNNIIGFNVTIPYKEHIIKYLDEVVYPAKEIGAINTVLVTKDKLIGYNTDYYGFIKSLDNIKFEWKNSKVLIIGGGGSAKAVLYAFHNKGAKIVDMVVRNENSVKNHRQLVNNIYNFKWDFNLVNYDIVVNCTPLGGANNIEKMPINIVGANGNTVFYDLNYTPEVSVFLKKGEGFGCHIINGKNMLLNQAYKAIEIWHEYIIEDL